MISSLLVEDKRLNERLNTRDSKSVAHPDNALLAKNQIIRKIGKQIVKQDLIVTTTKNRSYNMEL